MADHAPEIEVSQEEVEAIINSKEMGKDTHYLIKWKKHQSSWVHSDNLHCPDLLCDFLAPSNIVLRVERKEISTSISYLSWDHFCALTGANTNKRCFILPSCPIEHPSPLPPSYLPTAVTKSLWETKQKHGTNRTECGIYTYIDVLFLEIARMMTQVCGVQIDVEDQFGLEERYTVDFAIVLRLNMLMDGRREPFPISITEVKPAVDSDLKMIDGHAMAQVAIQSYYCMKGHNLKEILAISTDHYTWHFFLFKVLDREIGEPLLSIQWSKTLNFNDDDGLTDICIFISTYIHYVVNSNKNTQFIKPE